MIRLYAEICSGSRSAVFFSVSIQLSTVCPGRADMRSTLRLEKPASLASQKLSRNSSQVWIRPRAFNSLLSADWRPKLNRLIPASR